MTTAPCPYCAGTGIANIATGRVRGLPPGGVLTRACCAGDAHETQRPGRGCVCGLARVMEWPWMYQPPCASYGPALEHSDLCVTCGHGKACHR